MKNKVILNIPHSSLKLTKEFKQKEKYLNEIDILNFNKAITDLYTDNLFSSNKFNHLKAKYSRICCDVEKFIDNDKEEMSKFGMGVIYTHTNFKKHFLTDDNEYKNKVIKKYYLPYHKKLDIKISKQLNKNKSVILVDCHSFSKDIIMTGRTENLPDFCIGTNSNEKSKLVNIVVNFLTNLGYKVAVNYPYEGTMIPDFLLNTKTNNFESVMIEVNKKLYLSEYKKSKNFKKVKNDLFKLLNLLKQIKL